MPILNDSPTLISLLSFFCWLKTNVRRRGKRREIPIDPPPLCSYLLNQLMAGKDSWSRPCWCCLWVYRQWLHRLASSNHCLTNPYLFPLLLLMVINVEDKRIEEIINQLMMVRFFTNRSSIIKDQRIRRWVIDRSRLASSNSRFALLIWNRMPISLSLSSSLILSPYRRRGVMRM